MNFPLIKKSLGTLENTENAHEFYSGVMDVILLLLDGAEKNLPEILLPANTIKQLLVAGRLRTQLRDVDEANENVKKAISETKKAFKDTDKQIKALEKSNSTLLEEKEKLINKEKELQDLKADVDALKKLKECELDELNQNIKDINADIENVESKIKDKKAEIEIFRTTLSNADNELSLLSNFLDKSQKEVLENKRIIDAFPTKSGISTVDDLLTAIKVGRKEAEVQMSLDSEKIREVIKEIKATEEKLNEQ